MSFNFIAHHACTHLLEHLFYNKGKCSDEEEEGYLESMNVEGWAIGKRLPKCHDRENLGTTWNKRSTSHKSNRHPMLPAMLPYVSRPTEAWMLQFL